MRWNRGACEVTLQDQMKRFLDATPGISLLAYGDLSSGLILNSASRVACPREVLDLIGEKVTSSFSRLYPESLARAAEASGSSASIIHFTERSAQIFARLPGDADEVICAVCDSGVDLQPLLGAVQDLAGSLAGPE